MITLTGLGTALGASAIVPVCKGMVNLAKEIGGKKESTIIGYGDRVPCHMAGFVNAALVHGLNFGDICDEYPLHPGAAVIPVAFAVAEQVGKVSGKEFITAVTLGVDILVRMARSIYVKAKRDWANYGWNPQHILAYFSATAVAGKLLKLNESQMVNAFGLAYSQTAGSFEEVIGVGTDKAIYNAYAALAGALSARMAQRGIGGPRNSLEGKAGLFNVYFQGEYDSASLTCDLGKVFEAAAVGFYSFPCCAFNHPYIEGALKMVGEYGIHPDKIESITLFVGPTETFALCQPLETKRNPTTLSEAQMSLPYTVAVALTKGKPRLKHFLRESFEDREILRLSNKVDFQVSQEYGSQVGTSAARTAIEVKLRDGKVLRSDREGVRYGHSRNPMSKEDHIEKFRDCVSYSVKPFPKKTLEDLIDRLLRLEELEDIRRIVSLWASERGRKKEIHQKSSKRR
jgi:2-methylcitrate dehydratase PrpD